MCSFPASGDSGSDGSDGRRNMPGGLSVMPGRSCLREASVPTVPPLLLTRSSKCAGRVYPGQVRTQIRITGDDGPLPSIDETPDVADVARRAPAGRLVVDELSGRLVQHTEPGTLQSQAIVDVVEIDPE